MLVVLVPQFRAALAAKLGQEHPVIVHQPDVPVVLHHHVAVLEIVVGDAEAAQAGGGAAPPLGGQPTEHVRVVEVGFDEFTERHPLHPFHFDDGVPVAAGVYAAFQVLEMNEGGRQDADEVVAQLLVAALLVVGLAGKAAHRELLLPDSDRIDTAKLPEKTRGNPRRLTSTTADSSSVPLKQTPGFWTASVKSVRPGQAIGSPPDSPGR